MAHIGSRFMNWFDPEPTSSASSSELARGWLRSRILLVIFAVLGATVLGVLRSGAPGLIAAILYFILLGALTVALARRRGRRLLSARRD